MSDELSEVEKNNLLKGAYRSMSVAEYKTMLIKVFINQGKSLQEATKMAEDSCEKDGIKGAKHD